MKKILLILLLLTCTIAVAQTKCANFKTGTFMYDEEGNDTVITRTETTQTETSKSEALEISGTIEWVSDCEYILTCKYVNKKDKISQEMVGQKLYNRITETDGEKYTFECREKKNGPVVFTSEIIKITPQ